MNAGIAAAIVAVLVLGSLAGWMVFRSPEPAPAAGPDTAAVNPTEIEASVQQAALLLRAGDFDAARRQADEILAKVPDHVEARRISERARETADAVADGLREARVHHDAGRYEESARAAGDVLAVAPANADAKELMEESSKRARGGSAPEIRARGRIAEEARQRMAEAKAAAIAARAPALARAPYGAASKAEQDAQRLLKAGRAGDAMVKFYEASGLFRSAEVAARTETSTALTAEATHPETGQAAPGVAPAAPPAPAPPRPSGPEARVGPPALPGADATQRPVLPPTPPPAVPPQQTASVPSRSAPAPAATPPPAAGEPESVPPEQAIREVLGRYESALESRDLDQLRKIWPGLAGAQQTAISNDFRNASRITVEILDPRIAVTGASATVAFLRRYEMVTVEGQRLGTDTRTTMTLRRERDRWVIQDIRFEPAARRVPDLPPIE